MKYQKHIPLFPLNEYVESIIYIEGNNKGTGLPKTAMSLVFNLEDSFKLFTDNTFTHYVDYKKYWVAGLQTKATNVESYGLSKMLVVQFKTLGAFMFLKAPLHYYTNAFVSLENVFGKEAEETWDKLQEASGLNEKFTLIEQFLLGKLLHSKLAHHKLISCIESLLHDHHSSVKNICSKVNLSRKHLNYLSKEYTGVSPKTLSSLIRLQSTLKTMSTTNNSSLTNVAYQSEYFDQAHFINDFKKFTGLKPNEYAKLVNEKQDLKTIPHFIPFG